MLASSVIGPDISREKVDSFMIEVGATKVQIRDDFKIQPRDKEVYTNIEYVSVRRERDKFMTRYFSLYPVGTYVNWIFDAKGRFVDVYVNMDFVYD